MHPNKKSPLKKEAQEYINHNCILANNGFRPYERCDNCSLKVTRCTGMQYNGFILIISLLLLLFMFISDPLLIRINIFTIIAIIVMMGYRVMVNTDELARASFENIQLNNRLKQHSQNLQEEVLKQTKELKELAIHDRLTGLYNRYEFEQRLTSALEDAKKRQTQHVLCYMDLDQFKVVNDTSGHVAGDELLRQLSLLLSNHLSGNTFMARLGGDEFGLILYNHTLDEAKAEAQKILDTVCSYRFTWEDKLFTVGASIGMVAISSECNNTNDLLVSADAACYTAKENGRNQIYTFEKLDVELAKHRNDAEWIDEIQHALDEERFLLYGQPIKSLKIGFNTPHFEILIRMKNRDGKIIEPMAFIPAAERFHSMKLIDRWVIKESIYLLREVLDMGYICHFSINLSGQSLSDDTLIDYIKQLFMETEVPHEYICFELTETAAISNLTNALIFIKSLRELGCLFALDDFGSGLSSFAYLKNIPVDYLKIDGQFVKDIHVNKVNREMVRAVNDIAKVMGIEVICEYVENEQILQTLIEMDIDYAQGHYFCIASSIRECIDNNQAEAMKLQKNSEMKI